MNGLEQLKQGVSMARSRRSVRMPNGQEFEWYQTPLTIKQRERATKLAGKDKEDVLTVAMLVLIMKAQNLEGQKLFVPADLDELKTQFPETVVGELITEVMRDSLSEVDDEGVETSVDVAPKKSSPSSRRMGS
tara:strand:+ start:2091 stop:2489 length:399 start_codon:yes stop_codon:yes gene_type:complete